MTELPLSMRWVPLFATSVHRALLEEPIEWELESQADPLRKVLHLRLLRSWNKEELPVLRAMLKAWCEVNDCKYQRALVRKRDYRALIMLRGLGPLQENNPFLEESSTHAHRRNRR